MDLAPIIVQYRDLFLAKYKKMILPGQMRALNAITHCRGDKCQEVTVQCTGCGKEHQYPLSCGHRSCPKCQNYEVTKYLERQRKKLLPVAYFMITFTLPRQLRQVVYYNQKKVLELMFQAVRETLQSFGHNYKYLGADIGMTCILQTNTRSLDYHPHIHVVVPAGGIDKKKKIWVRKSRKYLFPHENLAAVFRGKFMAALIKERISLPPNIPAKWNVNCKDAGHGESALEYLSKYLYRGVISEKSIVKNENGFITFNYKESGTGKIKPRTMPGEDFLRHIAMHVLPKGFRRVRDYGFLHGNAKKTLRLLQVILIALPKVVAMPPRPAYHCRHCGCIMIAIKWRKSSNIDIFARNKASPT